MKDAQRVTMRLCNVSTGRVLELIAIAIASQLARSREPAVFFRICACACESGRGKGRENTPTFARACAYAEKYGWLARLGRSYRR